jgi:hypothetical protein
MPVLPVKVVYLGIASFIPASNGHKWVAAWEGKNLTIPWLKHHETSQECYEDRINICVEKASKKAVRSPRVLLPHPFIIMPI